MRFLLAVLLIVAGVVACLFLLFCNLLLTTVDVVLAFVGNVIAAEPDDFQ